MFAQTINDLATRVDIRQGGPSGRYRLTFARTMPGNKPASVAWGKVANTGVIQYTESVFPGAPALDLTREEFEALKAAILDRQNKSLNQTELLSLRKDRDLLREERTAHLQEIKKLKDDNADLRKKAERQAETAFANEVRSGVYKKVLDALTDKLVTQAVAK